MYMLYVRVCYVHTYAKMVLTLKMKNKNGTFFAIGNTVITDILLDLANTPISY